MKELVSAPPLVSNQWDPAPVPTTPCWVHYGEVSISRNISDPRIDAAVHLLSEITECEVKWSSLFKIRKQAHFHIDKARDTSIIFSIPNNPLRVYICEEGQHYALDLQENEIMILDAKSNHAARSMYQRTWTFFVSLTSPLSHEDLCRRVLNYAVSAGKKVRFPIQVDPLEDLSSLYETKPEIILP